MLQEQTKKVPFGTTRKAKQQMRIFPNDEMSQ
jgi:hypothetical protein